MAAEKDGFVKFAVVGVGNIGSRHLAVIAAEPNASLVDICDIRKDVCEKYSVLYNIPAHSDFTEMLRTTSADVINICTPHALHAPMAIEAADAGKNILVEKPMALTLEDTIRMDEAARKNNIRLMVVWQNRHNVPIKLEEGPVGQGARANIHGTLRGPLESAPNLLRQIQLAGKEGSRGRPHLYPVQPFHRPADLHVR